MIFSFTLIEFAFYFLFCFYTHFLKVCFNFNYFYLSFYFYFCNWAVGVNYK